MENKNNMTKDQTISGFITVFDCSLELGPYYFQGTRPTHSAFVMPLQVLLTECERLVITHQMIVVTGELEEVGVHQHAPPASVERGEHLCDGWNADLPLFKHSPLLHQEDVAGDGRVGVLIGVVVQSDNVALGEQVEEDGGDEREEADDRDEGRLHSQTLCGQPGLEEDMWH